jgi:hypothetical protein
LGDYLVSEITNVRTLMGLGPQTTPALPVAAPAGGSTSSTAPTPVKTDYRADALAQQVSNTQTLFGIQSSTDGSVGSLPPLAAESSQQIAFVAIQNQNIASEFSNIATLFGSLGIGTNTNSRA